MTNAALKAYETVRRAMVDCQLKTNNIDSEEVLRAFETVPREPFLPGHLQGSAYVDEDLPLADGRFMLEPLVQARLIQAARPQPGDKVLNIGDATGYASALLAGLTAEITAVEAFPGQGAQMKPLWENLGLGNIRAATADQAATAIEGYDIIVINGSVRDVPPSLTALLRPGGRLVAVLRPVGSPMGAVTLAEKGPQGQALSVRRLADAATPYLKEFIPAPDFVF